MDIPDDSKKYHTALLELFEKLYRVKPHIEDFSDCISEAIKPICSLVSIARVEVKLAAPINAIAPVGEQYERVSYSGQAANLEGVYTVESQTDEGGKVTFFFYPEFGHTFTAGEKEVINLLEKILYIYSGRARMGDMLTQTLETDLMTGVANSSYFIKYILKMIELHQIGNFAALYYNLKNFKHVNKIVPYRSGDLVMRQYAQLAKSILIEDELLARLGGDNYIALVKKERVETVIEELQNIRVNVETTAGQQVELPIQIRAGVYMIPDSAQHQGDIMLPVALAYQAVRQMGSVNVLYYTPEISQRILHDQQVVSSFTQALLDGEFVAYLQPKVDLMTGKIVGAEALARWNHRGEFLTPDSFIPALERDGVICELDFEILRQVCELIASWENKGFTPLPISINMSRWHLNNPDLVQRIDSIVKKYKVNPNLIEIELTETANYEEYQIMVEVFLKMQELGYHTSIDDFGTGYSSLTLLKKLDVDILKLDRSFLWELQEEKDTTKERILIKNIIRMANELGLTVLAEGVETTSQRDFLIESGCNLAQGFLYAKPMRKEEFEKRVFA